MDKTVENDVAIIHEDGRILYYSEILEFIELVSIYKEPRKLLLIIADDIMATIMGYVAGIANHIPVFCKHFLDKVAKHFWTLLQVQIGQSCKASTGSYPASRIAIADHI